MMSSLWKVENVTEGGESRRLLFRLESFPSLAAIQCVLSMRWLLSSLTLPSFSFLEME